MCDDLSVVIVRVRTVDVAAWLVTAAQIRAGTNRAPATRPRAPAAPSHASDLKIEIELEAAHGGTVMRGSGSMATHRLWRLLEPVLRMELQKGEAREARRLKAILESRPAAVTAS
jgi:hypothetical protein